MTDQELWQVHTGNSLTGPYQKPVCRGWKAVSIAVTLVGIAVTLWALAH